MSQLIKLSVQADMSSKMLISDIRFWVSLGCTKDERANLSLVSISIEYIFQDKPSGTLTDELKDTVCYLQTVELIQSLLEDKEFKLVEYLAQKIKDALVDFVKDIVYVSDVNVRVTKVSPPVPNLHGGVTFYL